ncbi:hypothetical protein C8J56DRAFT_1064413 [Mycena floridula]|nr:hypothetical protein C8J56DRAFT_1064404 [Mycena floridula]KAJ7574727.1 hypothetical protein C8J56DRAFT_1064413 [Mycena floridula]
MALTTIPGQRLVSPEFTIGPWIPRTVEPSSLADHRIQHELTALAIGIALIDDDLSPYASQPVSPPCHRDLAGLAVRTALPSGYKNKLAIENFASILCTSISGLAVAKMLIVAYEKRLGYPNCRSRFCHPKMTAFLSVDGPRPALWSPIRESALLFAKAYRLRPLHALLIVSHDDMVLTSMNI